VYLFGIQIFETFEWIGNISGVQRRHYFPQKSKMELGKLEFSPKGLLKYNSSVGLEAHKMLATALHTLPTPPVSVAPCERSFVKMELIK
jgi:hypothetical protein